MRKLLPLVALILTTLHSFGQTRYFTKNGKIHFDCTTPSSPESIDGTNDKATSVIDASSGAMEFAVLMKAFSFQKALMQEHFNENYVESDKFPKATFKGTISNFSTINLSKDGNYPASVKGQMTMHGITKDISANGTITVKSGAITAAKSEFKLLLQDYDVTIPSVVQDKVAKEAKISLDLTYQPVVK